MQKTISVWAVAIVSWLPFWEYVWRVGPEGIWENFIMFCLMGLGWRLTYVVWRQFELSSNDDDEKPIFGILCATSLYLGPIVAGVIYNYFN